MIALRKKHEKKGGGWQQPMILLTAGPGPNDSPSVIGLIFMIWSDFYRGSPRARWPGHCRPWFIRFQFCRAMSSIMNCTASPPRQLSN